MSERLNALRKRLTALLPQDLAKNLPNSFEPLAWLDWSSRAFQKQGATFYGTAIAVFLSSYFLADLSALLIAKYIPEPPPTRISRFDENRKRPKTLEGYMPIFARNLFNSQGLIPGEDSNGGGIQDLGGAPVKTLLPFNLVGTLIMKDELRSIATIEDKTANMIFPVRIQDEIPMKAKIIKIEARRVVFVNAANGRREYIELPTDLSTGPRISLGTPKSAMGGGGVEQVSPTQFSVARSEVDAALKDFNQVLTQARCVPNFENSLPSGFKCFQIVKGSIYDKIGMKDGDVLVGLNGQPVNDVGKAFQLLEELKTASHIEMAIKRDGRVMNMAYDIH